MKKQLTVILSALVIATFALSALAGVAQAQTTGGSAATTGLGGAQALIDDAAIDVGGGPNDVRTLPMRIGEIINILLSVLGLLFVIYIIWGGFLWMTGGAEGAKKAKEKILNATYGLIIIVLAYAISNFVIDALI